MIYRCAGPSVDRLDGGDLRTGPRKGLLFAEAEPNKQGGGVQLRGNGSECEVRSGECEVRGGSARTGPFVEPGEYSPKLGHSLNIYMHFVIRYEL